MKPLKTAQSQPTFQSVANSPAVKTAYASAPIQACETLAKAMVFLELKDDHNAQLDSAVQMECKQELKRLGPSSEASIFLGIISICRLPGCDVHALDANFDIMKHFSNNEAMPEAFEKARPAALSLPIDAIGILVFNDHWEILFLNGKVESGT